jgi:hypothetical protein
LAMGQNWPYVDIVPVDRLTAELPSTDREPGVVHIRHWRPMGERPTMIK